MDNPKNNPLIPSVILKAFSNSAKHKAEKNKEKLPRKTSLSNELKFNFFTEYSGNNWKKVKNIEKIKNNLIHGFMFLMSSISPIKNIIDARKKILKSTVFFSVKKS